MRKPAIEIVQGDITQRRVDAIVNAANSTLLGGGGVDGAIHRAAGPGLLEECRKLGGCRSGEVKATAAHNIRQAKHIIHTVGPIYGRESGREAELLASCYREGLRLAKELIYRSIAFPSISTGAYGYPIESASRIALTAVREFVETNPDTLELIEMVAFSPRDHRTYQQARAEVFGL